MHYPISLEKAEPGLWGFVAVNGDVQIGWCRQASDGWYVEGMDGKRLGGPFKTRKLAEQAGAALLARLAGSSNPGW
ncbi:hypothetical protein GF108_01200 [Phyllobacterium sp. SYP-B3895]|uniref:hypothetical protein n=1 Tax=Phyllobacterium sp. SYP-B3895 TaxID=2663240 RepID=UPI001299DE28|nr:hypothetical protein [Phyllobacterium sp. SYP-B3895]MRG54199.1 hypothetical protein [Phyllobacterium sp. SYP-B3895]